NLDKLNLEKNRISKWLLDNKPQLAKLEERLLTISQKKSEVEKINTDIVLGENEVTELTKLNNLKTKINSQSKDLKKYEEEANSNSKSLDDINHEITKSEEEIAKLQGAEIAKEELNGKVIGLNNSRDIVREIIDYLSKFLSISQQEIGAKEEFLKCNKEFEIIKDTYEKQYQMFLNEQAGILGSELTPGNPCPVCGSIDHPNIAQISEGALARSELMELKNKVEAERQIVESKSKRVGELTTQKETLKKVAVSKLKTVNYSIEQGTPSEIKDMLMKDLEDLKDKVNVINQEINNKDMEINHRKSLEQNVEIIRTRAKNLELSNDKLGKLISELKGEIKSEKAKAEDMAKGLKNTNLEEAQKQVRDLKESKSKLNSWISSMEKAYEEGKKLVTDNQAALDTIEKQLEGVTLLDMTSLENKRQDLLGYKKTISEGFNDTDARRQLNDKYREAIKNNGNKISKIEEEMKSLDSLAGTMNGQLAGKEKIMLETYIQMTYFDRVINQANPRLLKMTDGQYEMRRKKDGAGRQTQTGLELEVIDHYNGSNRSIKTLSGGESFMASLALALGMSDVIERSAGGIQIESLFVDEGFGSLDDDSLNEAINVLGSLTVGNRMVGIISHVSELKERIDKKIIITKTISDGSKIAIES
ncbi:MAG: SMC family ATPase, partial [Anaerovoracaceae bacterium]